MSDTLRAGLLTATLTLTACSGGGGDTTSQKPPEEKARPHVWSSQVQALDKAKGVEQTIMNSAQGQKQEIERQEK